ncbi:MAG: RNA polymerase sigma factor RpoD/SigA [Patescibacteria group bacterium]|nr:RNA polymerase sigma factor RpoD/SigA [Patescibacteria group bacterium]
MPIKEINCNSPSLDRYLIEIRKFSLLTPKEEKIVTKKKREGSTYAFDKLIKSNLRWVVKIAKSYTNYGVDLADLISEGNLGLIEAARKFDERLGYKFTSFSYFYIKGNIIMSLRDKSRMIRLPANIVNDIFKIKKLSRELSQELDRIPEIDEIAERLELSTEKVAKLIRNKKSFSLNFLLDDEDEPLINYIVDKKNLPPDEMTYRRVLSEYIDKAIDSLTDNEKFVLKFYFGFNGNKPLTLKEIGIKIGLTEERIRQIKVKAISRLRHPSRAKYFEGYK